LITVVQALIAPVVTATGSALELPSVRAYAFVALGKLCLEDESLAKKCIPAFAKELEVCEYPVVRNNVMVIMCDLCIK
jgi:condensin-2 complex subunit D3